MSAVKEYSTRLFVLAVVHTKYQWFIRSICVNTCIISDQWGLQPIFGVTGVRGSFIDLDNRQPPLLTQIDSYLLHIEAGLLECAAGQETNETAYLLLGSISKSIL